MNSFADELDFDVNVPLSIELTTRNHCLACADVLRSRQEREQGVCLACADRPVLYVLTPQGTDYCNARRPATGSPRSEAPDPYEPNPYDGTEGED